ncbi:MAG: VWA domain-containing protein [bacterium]|nr:VWA domain-containing protein [bacterium]
MVRFQDPWWLLLLLTIPLVVWRYVRAERGALKYSSIERLKQIRPSFSLYLRHILVVLRCVAIGLLAFALARPQRGREDTRVTAEGIDIMLVLDTSGSMVAEDLARNKNRLDVAKEVAKEFVQKRKNDRIGLVVFGEDAYTQCPLTLDYGVLLQFLDGVKIGMAGQDRTAIGDGLATALLRMKDSPAKSKVVILLTDGENNSGKISPMTATEMARTMGVKIYTVGAGTEGMAPVPTLDPFGRRVMVPMQVSIDEELLQHMANVTSGQYFRATDAGRLRDVYAQIDRMERTKTEVFHYMEWRELFGRYALAGGVVLVVEVVLGNTRLRKLP